MKKIIGLLLVCLAIFSNPSYAWNPNASGGVVSEDTISLTSLEVTTVLQSDLAAYLYGTNRFGGTTNYASMNSGGVISFRNVTSSKDVILVGNNDYISWGKSSGVDNFDIGVSANDQFVVPTSLNTQNVSASVVCPSNGRTSSYTVNPGTPCQINFVCGVLTSTSC